MTNHWIDFKNADVILAIGCNPAENHPVAMKWIDRAKQERGAKLIVVDPRLSRTALQADIFANLRPGTDIAFLGGMIHYALQTGRYDKEYVTAYTNAAALVHPGYRFTDGLFSGAGGSAGAFAYDTSTWVYQRDEKGAIKTDPTLQDPQCVFQLMNAHYSRYDAETVCRITGTPRGIFEEACSTFTATHKPGKVGTLLYAMGITQSTHGSQNVRATAVLQLLLGNIGRAGGGVNALRGESNVQGSTDIGLLYHLLPGYNPYPTAGRDPTLAKYIAMEVPRTSYWTNRDKFLISMLKAWWGDKATKANDFAYDYLPKADGGNHSHIGIFEEMAAGKIKGLFCWGQNPAVGGPNSSAARAALQKLDWLVCVDLFENETAGVWKAPGVKPADVKTEVFLLPAAASFEREGSLTNSGRWLQWRWQALNPPGEAKRDLWIIDRLFRAVRKAYYDSMQGAFPQPILDLHWDYGDEPDVAKVALEINGYTVADGKPVLNFSKLLADGSTACGNWIFSGYYNDLANPPVKRREAEKAGIGLHPNWGFAWPLNRRVLYNRASVDPGGAPWGGDDRWVLRWDGTQWLSRDVSDFGIKDAAGKWIPPATSAANPFIMQADGKGHLFSDTALKDGPFPEHYEPVESPVRNLLSSTQSNPAAAVWKSEMGKVAAGATAEYPFVGTTYRVTEHFQSGTMTRNSPWLCEPQPEMYAEISALLANELGVAHGDLIRVSTVRGAVEVRALVRTRAHRLLVDGRPVEIVGLPWHFGFAGLATGATANDLTPSVGDANTSIPEYKAFLCNVARVLEG